MINKEKLKFTGKQHLKVESIMKDTSYNFPKWLFLINVKTPYIDQSIADRSVLFMEKDNFF